MLDDYMNYLFTGDLTAATSAAEMASSLGDVALNEVFFAEMFNAFVAKADTSTGGGESSGGESSGGETGGSITGGVAGGLNSNNPQSYLDRALKNQGLDSIPYKMK